MDFWNRLIGGSGSSVSITNKLSPSATPDQRLADFTRVWQRILYAWRNAPQNDPNTQEALLGCIKRLTDLLFEEEKRSARLCMNFCYEKQIFIVLSEIGQAGSLAVIQECIIGFSTLIENEDEDFVGCESFACSLITFLQTTSQRLVPAFEGEFVELLFSIASKIRQNPGILGVWFTNTEKAGSVTRYEILEPIQRFAGIANKEDFPLFYLLIDHVHQEGKVGDFARTGLLYLVETASSSRALERWIVESDLATLMASGLGALYSQLSRKLVITHPTDHPSKILLLSNNPMTLLEVDAETPNSPDFKIHLETFLSYLTFWQDVLEHCRSVAVKQTLLDHFQVLFLQQLLYPSLLESSDVDGGSAVAVLTYVRVVLETLDYPEIIHLILSYLMNLPEKPQLIPIHSPTRRRRSLDMLSRAANIMDSPTPSIYSLSDLIMTSLSSKSQQTVSTTLRLVSTIFRKHYPYSIHSLLKTIPVSNTGPMRTIGVHDAEMEILFQMVSDLTGQDKNATQTYDDHLKDCQVLLESHPCTSMFLRLKTTSNMYESDNRLIQMHMHTLSPHDQFLQHLVQLFSTYFSNTVETNLVLTCVIIDLASCAYMCPEGWLFYDSNTYEFLDALHSEQDDLENMEDELAAVMDDSIFTNESSPENENQRLRDVKRARLHPYLIQPSPIVRTLLGLVAQVQTFRNDILNLDKMLVERRRDFEFTNESSQTVSSLHLPQETHLHSLKYSMRDFSSVCHLHPSIANGSSRVASQGLQSHPPAPHAHPTTYLSIPIESRIADAMQWRKKGLNPVQKELHIPPSVGGDERRQGIISSNSTHTNNDIYDNLVPEGGLQEHSGELTLSTLLTNILILQEFILELAALTQVRASLFSDVQFADG
ncbi:Retinoic acid induced 16-like protein-domain-containing protein [Trichophaea hybrida]|nr:Retinoic acid induced 16-like protein-domain-containing protein [Trichophaea hybrida]